MTTIQLNNENKTQVEFTYDNGLPYKKSISPEYEYGNWKKNNQIALIKVKLTDYEISLFKDKNNINLISINGNNDEIWIDLEDVYLVLEGSKYLDKKFEKDLKKSLNLTGNNLSVESLINKFHKDFQTKGFLKVFKGIQSIRDNAFKNINDSTHKPK